MKFLRVQDSCLGRVCVGGSVRGEKERAHWAQVLRAPREVCARWHTLH